MIQKPVFRNPDIMAANIKPLEGAQNVFIAYNPDQGLKTKKNLKHFGERTLSRYEALLEAPKKVGPTAQNGFKWVVKDGILAAVGKITSQSSRLIPIAIELNENGHICFLFGPDSIRNTKRGKKENAYRSKAKFSH